MPEWMIQMGMMVGSVGAVYAAVRADLATLHENLRHLEKATNEAHRRIDDLSIRRAGAK